MPRSSSTAVAGHWKPASKTVAPGPPVLPESESVDPAGLCAENQASTAAGEPGTIVKRVSVA